MDSSAASLDRHEDSVAEGELADDDDGRSDSWELGSAGNDDDVVDPDPDQTAVRQIRQVEAIAEESVPRSAFSSGRDVHRHFHRNTIFVDKSKHYHINHCHHHHYHHHHHHDGHRCPISRYNGWNGNGNVRSLLTDPYSRSLTVSESVLEIDE